MSCRAFIFCCFTGYASLVTFDFQYGYSQSLQPRVDQCQLNSISKCNIGSDDNQVLPRVVWRRFSNVIANSGGLFTKSELEKWRSVEFREKATKDDLVDIGNALVTRAIGTKLKGGLSAGNGALGSVSNLFFVLGEFKRGNSLLKKYRLFELSIDPMERIEVLSNALSAINDGILSEVEHDGKQLDALLEEFQTAFVSLKLNDQKVFTKAFSPFCSMGNLLFVLGKYDKANDVFSAMLKSKTSRLNTSGEEKLEVLGRKLYLWERQIHTQLALGKEEAATDSVAKYLDRLREYRKVWAEVESVPGEDYVDTFESVWLACLKFGMGPCYPRQIKPNSKPVSVGHFLGKRIELAYVVPFDKLPDKGQELQKERKAKWLLANEKVDLAIDRWINDKQFSKMPTINVLRFLQIENKLARGKGEKAFELLKELEEDWADFRKNRTSKPTQMLLDSFHDQNFPFEMYREYLGSYFNSEEFRKLAKSNGKWNYHSAFFGYEKPLPKFEKKSKLRRANE